MRSTRMLVHDGEILSRKVNELFGGLYAHGFQIKAPSIKHTAAIGDYIEIEAVNASTAKGLVFTYAPAVDIRPESVSVFLQNGSGDTFSIGDYLSSKKLDPKLRQSICLVNYHGSLDERIDMALSAAKEIIFEYLEKLVIGTEWESVPIQWGNMK